MRYVKSNPIDVGSRLKILKIRNNKIYFFRVSTHKTFIEGTEKQTHWLVDFETQNSYLYRTS